jgi:NADH:ubiquinone oxidoreductase subunit 5 (subunit L)/multisubunit Na+/H+ antiporter MnhA subunit
VDDLPLKPVEDPRPPKKVTPAPPWVALLAAWLGLLTLICSIVLPFLPGSRRPREELEHRTPFAPADRWLPFPIYLSVVALFLGIVVLWHMRKQSRPLPQPMLAQRLQAWVGIVLALIAVVFMYAWVFYSVAWKARG